MSKLNQEELLEWLEQAHKYFTFEPPGKDNPAYQQIKELIQKAEVTEEWIGRWNQVIAERVNVKMKKDFIREEISLVYPGTENLAQMLGEAGVKVVRK